MRKFRVLQSAHRVLIRMFQENVYIALLRPHLGRQAHRPNAVMEVTRIVNIEVVPAAIMVAY